MINIDEFLFKISGYKPEITDGQFYVTENTLKLANEAYDNKNYEVAVKIWNKFANLNSGVCLLKLAGAYWEGNGVEKDYKKSFQLLLRGTLLVGGTQNYFNLAISYQIGEFVEKNIYYSVYFYICTNHYANEGEELKAESKKRIDELYIALNESEKIKIDSLLKAIKLGFEPAGMSVALELLDTLK